MIYSKAFAMCIEKIPIEPHFLEDVEACDASAEFLRAIRSENLEEIIGVFAKYSCDTLELAFKFAVDTEDKMYLVAIMKAADYFDVGNDILSLLVNTAKHIYDINGSCVFWEDLLVNGIVRIDMTLG